jgi:predicted  nucleic acid-binding Zn-ribbon protein
MSEERFEPIEKMLAQLIQMVGHNNAITEELRQDVGVVKQDVDVLKQDVTGIKQQMASLDARMEKGFADVIGMVNLLGEKVDRIEATQVKHSHLLEVFAVRTTKHEAEILGLKRAK